MIFPHEHFAPVNILIATDVFPPGGGGSGWSTFHLAKALRAGGHRVEIVQPVLDLDGVQTRVYEGLDVAQVGYRAANVPGLRAWQRTRALEQTLSTYLAQRAREFDVIHAQHMLTIGAAVAAKELSGVPVVSTVRDYWPVCLYGTLWRASTLWRDNAVCPICHGSELTRCLAQKYGSAARWLQPAIPFVEREMLRRQRALAQSDAVIAVSEYVANTLRGVGGIQNIHVIPNLIDVAETQQTAREHSPIDKQPPYLIFVGKLNNLKGANLLSEILEKSEVKLPLFVVGDGELRSSLEGKKGLVLRGWLPNAETLGLVAGAQALLFPSRWAEPLTRTLLEAQALGIPSIAFNLGGNRDIIGGNISLGRTDIAASNSSGLLSDTVDEFSVGVRRLADDEPLRALLAANAIRTAQAKFSPAVVVPQLERIYQAEATFRVAGDISSRHA